MRPENFIMSLPSISEKIPIVEPLYFIEAIVESFEPKENFDLKKYKNKCLLK